MNSGKVEEIEKGTKEGGKDFGRGVKGYGEGGFKKGDFFKDREGFRRSGEEVVFDEKVST